MQFEQSNSSRLARWAPLLLRLIVGYGFAVHGIAKLSRGPGSFAGILQAIGVPAPHLMAWVTILSELLGGIAIGTGAFVTIFSIPLAVILLVAIFTVHLPYGFSSIKLIAVTQAGAQFGPPGYECNLLYLAALVALVLGGAGPLAVDAWLKRNKTSRPGFDKLMRGGPYESKRVYGSHSRRRSLPCFRAAVR
jgi:putative oxidoreductase